MSELERFKERLGGLAEAMIISIAVACALLGAHAKSFGDPAFSRLATVYSLTEHGTFFIDPVDGVPNHFERRTIDKVVVDGRILSSKPPMFTLLMTAEYVVLRAITGWNLDTDQYVNKLLRWMTIVLVGLPYVLTLVFFSKTARFFVADPLVRAFMLFALAFCTQLWGYSGNINNHVPGTGTMMIAVYFAVGIGLKKLKPSWWRIALYGLCGGLTFTLDTPGTIFVAAAGLWLLYAAPVPGVIWGGLGIAVPIGIQSWALYATTGSPLPVQTNPDFYLSETSYWRNPMGVDALNETTGQYLFHMTLGRSGLFSLYPILLAGAAAALQALVYKDAPWRKTILAAAGTVLVLTYYYATGDEDNYGGESYGFRWYIIAMPILLLMAGPIFAGLRTRWQWGLVCFSLAISFYSAWECTQNPWRANQEWICRFLGPTYIW